jgi:hypothetical protein
MARGACKLFNPWCGSSKKFVLPFVLSGNPPSIALVIGVRDEWILRDSKTFVAYLNNVDIS